MRGKAQIPARFQIPPAVAFETRGPMTRANFLLGTCLISLSLGVTVSAQECDSSRATGKLAGTVIDPSGAVIPAATVELDATATKTTNEQGRFEFSCVPAGRHQIHVHADTFSDAENKLDFQASSKAPALVIKLQLPTIETAVNASDSPVSTDADHGGGTKTLNEKDLAALSDDPDDFQRELQVLAAAAGGAPGQAIITVDGFQNASGLPPKSSIASVRVSPDLFSSEYETPPYRGSRIEIFTKPGQESLHGALFFSDSDPFVNAKDPFALAKTALGRKRYGFELTGPIQKKKSSFTLDLEKRDIDDFATVKATTLNNTFQPEQLVQSIAAPQRLWISTARTDWQLPANNLLVLSYTGSVNSLENQGVGGLVLPEAGYNSTASEHNLRITEIATLSPKFLHETHLGFSWKQTNQDPLSTAPSLQVAGYFTGGGSTAQVLHSRERDLEVDDDVLLTTRRHTVKGGIQLLGAFMHINDPDTFNGAFTFGGGLAPALDGNGQPIAGTSTAISGLEQYRRTLENLGSSPTLYRWTQGNPLISFTQWRTALYLQDQWKLAPRISLSLGLRYALQTEPESFANIAPRIGVAWSPDKKQRWVFHARAGIFYSPITTQVTQTVLRLNNVRQTQTLIYSPSFQQPTQLTSSSTAVGTQWQFAQNPTESTSFQSHLGVEHDFPKNWHVQANVYLPIGWSLLRSRNINAPILSASTTNPLLAPRPIVPGKNIYEFQQTGNLHGQVVFTGLDQHSLKHFRIFVGYLFFNLRSDADTPITRPQSSYSDHGEIARPSWQATHRIFTIGQVDLPYKFALTTFLDTASGLPYNLTTGTDNGEGDFNVRPSYSGSQGVGVYQTSFGLLSTTGFNGNVPRNAGTMPWSNNLDCNLSRSFTLHGKSSTDRSQQVTFNARATNMFNHTNVTGVNGVVGSSLFGRPYSADAGRRVEFGARYSF